MSVIQKKYKENLQNHEVINTKLYINTEEEKIFEKHSIFCFTSEFYNRFSFLFFSFSIKALGLLQLMAFLFIPVYIASGVSNIFLFHL